MSSAPHIYHVDPEPVSTPRRVARALFALLIFVAASFAIHALLRRPGSVGMKREEYVVDAVIAMATDFFSRRKGYDLEVDDEVIRVSGGDWPRHRVRRGRVRYLRESDGNWFHEPGLKLSEHGPIGTRFLGGVWIPVSLPEYQQIEAKATSWMAIG
jgi:hypothetical protein